MRPIDRIIVHHTAGSETQSAASIRAEHMATYGLDPWQVEGHRENEPASTPTLCPGFDPALLRAALDPSIPAPVPTSAETP